ncbi:4-fold beta flower protein [Bacillus wiedmannii]|uniref:4-fold beta flower protein n=1 Tax=Bacillus wiedmannii TaxID=1890302 RepID=UPI000BF09711|nr:hypothetical protein [Bacillus wiedmannii]PEI77401.1 hypothetical protein CN905_15400 [Bacillus wiedmannii]
MKPLYTKNCDLVAWLNDEKRHIFDRNMNWIAFVSGSNVFSAQDAKWLGPIRNITLFDTNGRAILWNPNSPIGSMGTPITPYKPYIPNKPYKPYKPYTPRIPHTPRTPMNGWSPLTFSEWANI